VLFTFAAGITGLNSGTLDMWDKAHVVVQSFRSGERRTVHEGGSGARYIPTGHLVYAVGGNLFATPFNLDRLEVTGDAAAVLEGVRRAVYLGAASGSVFYNVSDNGSLVYVPGPSSSSVQADLAFSNSQGAVNPLKLRAASYQFPRISPDGTRVAVGTDDGMEANIWIYDLSGTSAVRQLTLEGRNRFPVWSADSRDVAFQSDRDGDPAIFRQRADGGSPAERLTQPEPGAAHVPESWSPDGRTLLFAETKGATFSVMMLSIDDKKTTRVDAVPSSKEPITPVFSPDGRWIAYTSSDGSNRTVIVQPFPWHRSQVPGRPWRLASRLGPDGEELFYYLAGGTRTEVVRVMTQPTVSFGNPRPVSIGTLVSRGVFEREYDITPDGKRFIGVLPVGQPGSAGTPQINVVVNWFEELKARVPSN
jgi:eukaryotic-like serine/threonine-protein kinase